MSFVSQPAKYSATVTPSNSVNLESPTTCLYIGVSGDVSVEMVGGMTQVFVSVPVGILPVQCTRVNSTGTTASSIVALWS